MQIVKKNIIPIALALLLFAEILAIKVIPILKETFPLENTEAVLFTLSQNIEGSRDFVITLFIGVLIHSFVMTAIIIVAIFALHSVLKKFKRTIPFAKFSKISLNKLTFSANIIAAATFAYSACSQLPLIDYYVAWQKIDTKSEHSDFYAKEYANPDSVQITFKDKRNLILIFLESMEYNFQDSANGGNLQENLIPEITEYIKNEQSFIPGGTQVWGMGWTMADAVAKTCGIPLTLPPSINNSFKPLKNFLPGATCLTDILMANGYEFMFSQGSNLNFSGMKDFLNTHSAPKAFGFLEYGKKDSVKKEGSVFWGIRDELHYELVKEQIRLISKQEKPWALWMFTIDTHTPYGFLDPICQSTSMVPTEKQYPFVVRCSSMQLKKFIEWAKKQEWYSNTTIVVVGDHATMAEPKAVGFKDSTITHYWLNFFINSTQTAEAYKRDFTSLDFFPTILESIGANIPEGKLGLGRSLYSTTQTLLEKYGIDSLNKALKKKSIEYDYFLYFKK